MSSEKSLHTQFEEIRINKSSDFYWKKWKKEIRYNLKSVKILMNL